MIKGNFTNSLLIGICTVLFFSPRSDEPLMLPLLKAGFDRVNVDSYVLNF